MPGRREERSLFSDSGGGAIGLGTSRKALSKGIPWAQARLQMQIGHARATRRTLKHHSDMETQRSLFAGKFQCHSVDAECMFLCTLFGVCLVLWCESGAVFLSCVIVVGVTQWCNLVAP